MPSLKRNTNFLYIKNRPLETNVSNLTAPLVLNLVGNLRETEPANTTPAQQRASQSIEQKIQIRGGEGGGIR